MVVKTDICNYTEYKIYPGRGQKFVAKDGKVSFFITAKADSLFHQKIKAVKLTWSQAWRRMNKKGKLEVNNRRAKKKGTKFQKAIVGLTLEDMRAKRMQKDTLRAAAKETAVKEAKARQVKRASKPQSTQPKQKIQQNKMPQQKAGAQKQKNFKANK
ncbi:unnamed protein product [Amoebophrya sp. A120]|nr:unnamed protein product [Amoebophrya sp. A120]|eukprot:GSA120T00001996001.1